MSWQKLKAIFRSYDMVISIAITITMALFLPNKIDNELVKDIYSVGLSILSIVFSLFFAALAIIVSSSDDEFVRFLERNGNLFDRIVDLYKVVLLVLLISLLYTFGAFGYTSYLIVNEYSWRNYWSFLIFIFLFSYSLLAVFSVSLNSITFAKKRSKYLKFTEGEKKKME